MKSPRCRAARLLLAGLLAGGAAPLAAAPRSATRPAPRTTARASGTPTRAITTATGPGTRAIRMRRSARRRSGRPRQAAALRLAGEGCFTGSCLEIRLAGPPSGGGVLGCLLDARTGDVLVSRDETEQDFVLEDPRRIWAPAGGAATLGGAPVACLELPRDVPAAGRIFDVTDNLADVAARPNLAALLAVLEVESPPGGEEDLQTAVWQITDADPGRRRR